MSKRRHNNREDEQKSSVPLCSKGWLGHKQAGKGSAQGSIRMQLKNGNGQHTCLLAGSGWDRRSHMPDAGRSMGVVTSAGS